MIMKGQKINDRYQIIKSIGAGGMANVYLAYDTILDRNVAVKVLRGDLANDEKFVRRFQREALSASSLSHPNIVEVYDVGEDQGNYYIVMEYIEGKHLKELLKKRGKLTISETVDIISQICDGLATAHDSYIIHRDIKPQNIMILDSGLVKITDFGIAQAINSTQLTQTNSIMGSVHYLPPEQASGNGSTMQSDIYSMGIMMYELLTGELPFRGDNAVEIALKQLKEPLPNIKEKLPDIPNAIVNVIKRSTAKNPKNRYADAREMLEDIKTATSEERANEPIIEYKYPEVEENDRLPKKEKNKEDIKSEVVSKKVDDDEVKKENKLLLILGIVFTAIVVGITALVVVLPEITSVDNTKVPDVSNLTELEAESRLLNEELKVNTELKYVSSETIEEGKVVRTEPSAGRSVKEGTTITLYISSGSNTFELEDFTGENYYAIRERLISVYKVTPRVEKKSVENPEDIEDPDLIIDQKPEAGTKVTASDEIILYIPDISVYPDFTKGTYTLKEIEKFAEDNDLTLEIEYVDTTDSKEVGKVIWQSREAKTPIARGAIFTIRVGQEIIEDVESSEESKNAN